VLIFQIKFALWLLRAYKANSLMRDGAVW